MGQDYYGSDRSGDDPAVLDPNVLYDAVDAVGGVVDGAVTNLE